MTNGYMRDTMSHTHTHDMSSEPDDRTVEESRSLHGQAEQMSFTADQMDKHASDTHAEADALQEEAGQMRKRSEDLHRQADNVLEDGAD